MGIDYEILILAQYLILMIWLYGKYKSQDVCRVTDVDDTTITISHADAFDVGDTVIIAKG